MERQEIIKSLKACANGDCVKCAFDEMNSAACVGEIIKAAAAAQEWIWRNRP